MPTILSYGGGVQSVAMCVLVAQGILPRPDAVIAADTGREIPSTWEYAETHTRPLLRDIGLDLHVAGHELATVDLYAHNGDVLIPAYTKTGKLQTFCSSEWKKLVVIRYARRVLGLTGPLEMWIGISLDERRRAKSRDGYRYPLLDLHLTRHDCLMLLDRAGLPIPAKSRCWMCPHQTDAEWREVRDRYPALWREAIALDADVRQADERGDLYLHASRRPLDEGIIDHEEQLSEPLQQCGLGWCYV